MYQTAPRRGHHEEGGTPAGLIVSTGEQEHSVTSATARHLQRPDVLLRVDQALRCVAGGCISCDLFERREGHASDVPSR